MADPEKNTNQDKVNILSESSLKELGLATNSIVEYSNDPKTVNLPVAKESLSSAKLFLNRAKELHSKKPSDYAGILQNIQKAAELMSKCFGSLSVGMSYKDHKTVSHNSPIAFVEVSKGAQFTNLIEFAKTLNPKLKTDTGPLEKLIKNKKGWGELRKLSFSEIEKLFSVCDTIEVRLRQSCLEDIISILKRSLPKLDVIAFTIAMCKLYCVGAMTFPHQSTTEYPDEDPKPWEYNEKMGVVQAIPLFLDSLDDCDSQLSAFLKTLSNRESEGTKRKAVKISEILEINPKRNLERGEKAKYVSMADLIQYRKKISAFRMREFSSGSKFKNGDTLLARITPCLENGKTAFVDVLDEGEVGWGSTEFMVLSGKEGKTDSNFVYYLACSPEFREIAIKSMSGTSGRQRVQESALRNASITIPPLSEQRAIAKILSDIDAKIELNQQVNKTLEEIGQALFKRWFVDFEFPNEQGKPYKSSGGKMVDSELGDIPEGWDIKSLSEIATYLNGLALQKYPPMGDGDLPVIKIRELKQGITGNTDMANSSIPKEYIIEDGDILFSWSGSLELVIWSGGKGALNQHLFKVSSEQYPKWFYYYWTKQHLEQFRGIAKDKATTMGHIKRRHLDEALVCCPDKGVLRRMDATMVPIVEKIKSLGTEVKELRRTRDSLLPKLVSG